jgi:hypothetical protein
MARFRFRAQVWALALACLLPLSAQARTLAQQAPNPFLAAPDNALGGAPASQAAAPAAAPASEPVSPFSLPAVAPTTEPLAAPSALPAPPVSAPAPEAGTAAATDGVQPGSGDPCACTATGLSGGTNTSRIGCGQFDLVLRLCSNHLLCECECHGGALHSMAQRYPCDTRSPDCGCNAIPP